MKKVENRLRVWHIPQVPMEPFYVPVATEKEASLIMAVLAIQHLWLEKNNIITDYSNAMGVEMFEDEEWTDYYNDKEAMDWADLDNEYFNHSEIIRISNK